jgi:nucleoside-diphosphate-sugar epimerase
VHTVARRDLPSHPKLRHTRADLGTAEAVRALAGVEVLWHLAFALWRGGDADGANRAGTRAVLAARPGRLVFASSAAVYGAWPDNPCPLFEEHDPRPNPECRYAGQKLEAERAVLNGLPAAALRLPAVLGPHVDPRVGRSTAGYRLVVPAVAGARQRLQFLGEDDAAGALHLAGTTGFTGVCNIAPADWLEAAQIARLARSRVVALPRPLLLGVAEAAYRLRASPFGADRAVLVSGPLALDAGLASARFGWRASAGSAGVLGGFLGGSHGMIHPGASRRRA